MTKVRFIFLALLTLLLALVMVRFPAPPQQDLDSAWSMTLLFAQRHAKAKPKQRESQTDPVQNGPRTERVQNLEEALLTALE